MGFRVSGLFLGLVDGIDKLADAVSLTVGPKGICITMDYASQFDD